MVALNVGFGLSVLIAPVILRCIMLRVLVACEESQTVCKAFRAMADQWSRYLMGGAALG